LSARPSARPTSFATTSSVARRSSGHSGGWRRLRALFLLVVGCLLGTLVFAAIAIAADSVPFLAIGACSDLIGHFFIFFAVLRSGAYTPLRPPAGLGPVRY
jgi:hypothetical protein